jgi:hypothetical protein
VEDLQAKLERLLTDADECALIGKLATDAGKRDLFNRLANDLRGMASDVQAMIALKRAEGDGLTKPDDRPSAPEVSP